MISRRAFTLIELLVTVGIIAILAAIAIPNMLEAQARSKVSRAKNDLRTLAGALMAYQGDNHAFPDIIPPNLDDGGAWLMVPLTTPVAYISSLPADPFTPPNPAEPLMPIGGRKTYRYTSHSPEREKYWAPATVWSLASNGPNMANDTGGIYHGYSPVLFFGGDPLLPDWALYDPSNGTVSRGDIFRAIDFVMQ